MAKIDIIPRLFEEKRNSLLAEVENYRYGAENSTLGDYADLGFLAHLLQILMED